MDTRVALLEERQLQDRRRMEQFETKSEKDIEKLSAIIKETESRVMAFVQSEFNDIEKALNEVVAAAKQIKEEQARLSDENKEQRNQAKISEAQTATAVFVLAAVFTIGELFLRFVI